MKYSAFDSSLLRTGLMVCASTLFTTLTSTSYAANLSDLSKTSLEDLLQQEVTSVSKKQENLYTAPAAVYVITAEDIRRRGVRNLPQALAMAPGLQVRAIDGNKWSVGARGNTGIYANKLLVQIDGRSIYTPTFSGVYWDQHNIPMSEIERIEVIRGSGATLWGANAVNGVINIITKHSSDSQGVRLEASIGTQDDGSANARVGGKLSDDVTYRVNAQSDNLASNDNRAVAGEAFDSSNSRSLNLRLDGKNSEQSSWDLSAGFHDNKHDQTLAVLNVPPPSFFAANVADEVDVETFFLKGNWNYQHANGAQSQLQLFVDNYQREEAYLSQDVTTYDLDYQISLPAIGKHHLMLGAGYRSIEADYRNSYAVSILPNHAHLDLFSLFIQDEYQLIPDKLSLTFGSKFEHHEYTGWETQPNIRLSYTPAPGHFAWGAISRAVRTPSVAERGSNIQGGVTVPITTWVQGNTEIDSEKLTSYELGYRYFSSNLYTFDASIFYNKYDDYLSFEQINPITFQMGNNVSGNSYGLELSSVWQLKPNWQLAANYTYTDVNLSPNADSSDFLSGQVLDRAFARNMLKLHSAWDINPQWSLDAWVYYIDELPVSSNFALFQSIAVDDLINTNVRVAWRPDQDMELAVTARNLFDSHTLESVGESLSVPTEIDRSIVLTLSWDL